jgi:hypothetical protein
MRLASLVLSTFVVSSLSYADSLKSTATRLGTQASVALKNKDIKGFTAILRKNTTPDFKYVEANNSMTLDQMLGVMKGQFAAMKTVKSASSKLLRCVEHGKTGITATTHSITAMITGPDRKLHLLVASGDSKDTWVKVGGAWKMSVMLWGKQKMTMDGKPFNPSAPMKPASTKGKA